MVPSEFEKIIFDSNKEDEISENDEVMGFIENDSESDNSDVA